MNEKLLDELINLTTKGDISANELEAIKSLIELMKYSEMWGNITLLIFLIIVLTGMSITGYSLIKGLK